MNLQKTVALLIACSAIFADSSQCSAEDPDGGILDRIFRIPAFMKREELADHTKAMSDEKTVLFEIQKRQEERREVRDDVDLRIQMALSSQRGMRINSEGRNENAVSLDEIRSHLETRGYNPGRIDERIDRAANASQLGRTRSAARRSMVGGLRANNDPVAPPAGVVDDVADFDDDVADLDDDVEDFDDDIADFDNDIAESSTGDGNLDTAAISYEGESATLVAGGPDAGSVGDGQVSDRQIVPDVVVSHGGRELIELGDALPFDDEMVILPADHMIPREVPDVLELRDAVPNSDDMVILPVENLVPDARPEGIELGDAMPFGSDWPNRPLPTEPKDVPGHLIIPVQTLPASEGTLPVVPQTDQISQAANSTTAGQTASDYAAQDTPAATMESRTIQRTGAGLRGGFSRGRIRTR